MPSMKESTGGLAMAKVSVDPSSPQAAHQVDGLAGATLTSKGVDNLLHFWLGPKGFGPFIANLRDSAQGSSQASTGGR